MPTPTTDDLPASCDGLLDDGRPLARVSGELAYPDRRIHGITVAVHEACKPPPEIGPVRAMIESLEAEGFRFGEQAG